MLKYFSRQYVLNYFAGLILITSPLSSLAAGAGYLARNEAMGGVGVASANLSTAPLINPALIAISSADDQAIQLIFPAGGLQLSDNHRIIKQIDTMVDRVHYYENYFRGFTPSQYIQHYAQVRDMAGEEAARLRMLKGKEVNAKGGLALALTVPNATLPFAIIAKATAVGHLKTAIVQQDIDYLQGVYDGTIIPMPGDQHKLRSSAHGLAAIVADYGLALAHTLNADRHPISFSLTPKVQQYTLFNYTGTLYRYDKKKINDSSHRKVVSAFNMDVGLTTDLDDHWRFGLVGQNLLSKDIQTKRVNDYVDYYQIRPLITTGIAWNTSSFTTALDADLTKTRRFRSQVASQYAGVGAEYRMLTWLQLRAGYRMDVKGNDANIVSAGFGLLPFKGRVQLDIAGTKGRGNTWGAMAQLAYNF